LVGVIKQAEPLPSHEESEGKKFTDVHKLAELAFASNSRTRADLSRELGWQPKKTTDDLKKYIYDEVNYILSNEKK